MQESFSEILKRLKFKTAKESGLSIHKSPIEKDKGTFFLGEWVGMCNTVAVDQIGRLWVKEGHVDLAPYGFAHSIPEATHCTVGSIRIVGGGYYE